METTQISIYNNKCSIYIQWSTIQFKKEGNTDPGYNKNGPWKHYARWNKLDTKGHLLYDSTYMMSLEIKFIENGMTVAKS